MNGKVFKESYIYIHRARKKLKRQSELKHKFEQVKQGKFIWCKDANLYVKILMIDN